MTEAEKIKHKLEVQLAVSDTIDSDFVVVSKGNAKKLIVFLAEQQPVPAELEGGGANWWDVCGNCHTTIIRNYKFCPECGRGILWA